MSFWDYMAKYALPALAVGAPLAGAVIGSRASKNAAQIQAAATDRAMAAEAGQFQTSQNNLAPWLQAGASVLPELTRGVSAGGNLVRPFTGADFQTDPGYQFRLGEGNRAIENNASARGMLLSGATLKALQRYGQDYASNEYQNAFDRYQNQQTRNYNALAGVAGVGQQAVNTGVQLGQNFGSNASNLITQRGNAQASGRMGASNYLVQGLGGVFNNLQNQEMLRQEASRDDVYRAQRTAASEENARRETEWRARNRLL